MGTGATNRISASAAWTHVQRPIAAYVTARKRVSARTVAAVQFVHRRIGVAERGDVEGELDDRVAVDALGRYIRRWGLEVVGSRPEHPARECHLVGGDGVDRHFGLPAPGAGEDDAAPKSTNPAVTTPRQMRQPTASSTRSLRFVAAVYQKPILMCSVVILSPRLKA